MMDVSYVGIPSALYLGILTSISPCPLATNIAAISYIGRRVGNPMEVLLTGLLYTLGRTMTYVALGTLIALTALSMPVVAHFLEKYMNRALGPILIIAGMFLLGLLGYTPAGPTIGDRMKGHIDATGIWGGALLGVIFALSFCPTSAALFFGSLIPLALKYDSIFTLPLVYGVGTALPVLAFAILLTTGARWVGGVFQRFTVIELWARRITGAAFIVVGILYSLTYVFGIQVLG